MLDKNAGPRIEVDGVSLVKQQEVDIELVFGGIVDSVDEGFAQSSGSVVGEGDSMHGGEVVDDSDGALEVIGHLFLGLSLQLEKEVHFF